MAVIKFEIIFVTHVGCLLDDGALGDGNDSVSSPGTSIRHSVSVGCHFPIQAGLTLE